LALELPLRQWLQQDPQLEEVTLRERAIEAAHAHYAGKTALVEPAAMRQYERAIMLQSVDSHWREHLAALDQLRQGIHLRGYAQKDPKQEYKREAFELFSLLLDMIKTDVTRILMTVQIRSAEELRAAEEREALSNVQYQHADAVTDINAEPSEGVLPETDADADADKAQPFVRGGQKVGRNDPCPCGSGKKYKQCHGKLA
jgi:preprotein translocase subunit SecA